MSFKGESDWREKFVMEFVTFVEFIDHEIEDFMLVWSSDGPKLDAVTTVCVAELMVESAAPPGNNNPVVFDGCIDVSGFDELKVLKKLTELLPDTIVDIVEFIERVTLRKDEDPLWDVCIIKFVVAVTARSDESLLVVLGKPDPKVEMLKIELNRVQEVVTDSNFVEEAVSSRFFLVIEKSASVLTVAGIVEWMDAFAIVDILGFAPNIVAKDTKLTVPGVRLDAEFVKYVFDALSNT